MFRGPAGMPVQRPLQNCLGVAHFHKFHSHLQKGPEGRKDISRWRKPPVLGPSAGEPRQGRRKNHLCLPSFNRPIRGSTFLGLPTGGLRHRLISLAPSGPKGRGRDHRFCKNPIAVALRATGARQRAFALPRRTECDGYPSLRLVETDFCRGFLQGLAALLLLAQGFILGYLRAPRWRPLRNSKKASFRHPELVEGSVLRAFLRGARTDPSTSSG